MTPKSHLNLFRYIRISSLRTNLQFKSTQEKNTTVNFLGLLINKNTKELALDIYWKPTSTDTTIHFSSNYTMEQKLVPYRYLISRMISLPLEAKNKHKKWNIILSNEFSYFLISKPNTQISRILSHLRTIIHRPTLKKRDIFTYCNPMIRNVTNFLKSSNIQSTFRTNNTIRHKIKIRTNNTSTCMRSGIYQLQYHNCNHSYIGQNARCLEPRYKEHVEYI